MNWPRFRNALTTQYHEQPQHTRRIELAVESLRHGLEELARLGHVFHLAEGPAPAAVDFPRLMFHLTAAPRGHLVLCREDAEFLGPGWFDTLDEAKHADGMGQQFKRGGIFPKRNVPAVINGAGQTQLDKDRDHGHR